MSPIDPARRSVSVVRHRSFDSFHFFKIGWHSGDSLVGGLENPVCHGEDEEDRHQNKQAVFVGKWKHECGGEQQSAKGEQNHSGQP